MTFLIKSLRIIKAALNIPLPKLIPNFHVMIYIIYCFGRFDNKIDLLLKIESGNKDINKH